MVDPNRSKLRGIVIKIKTDSCGKILHTFDLQNSSANIRRMKKRLVELQANETSPADDVPFTDGRIVDNAEANRVQILFDTMPDEATRSHLKGGGWRWSPFNKAWQRKRTPQALQSARRIVGVN